MSAGLDLELFKEKDGENTGKCAVVSIYEDFGGRDLLLSVCDSLAATFKDDLEFQTDWWRFKFLADPTIGRDAARKAKVADLILVAAQSPELPSAVKRWFEGWLPNRSAGDGALVFVQPGVALPAPDQLMAYLRSTAQRAHLDYLRLGAPEPVKQAVRSGYHQSEFDEMTSYRERPPHWGINE